MYFQFKDLMNKIEKDDDEVDEDGNPIQQVNTVPVSSDQKD
jgi:hypothetical protein